MKRKETLIEIYEEWRKGWTTPNIWVKIDQGKKYSPENRMLLREHMDGEFPFVKFSIPKEKEKK